MSFSQFWEGFKYFLLITVPVFVFAFLVSLLQRIPEWIAEARAKSAGINDIDKLDGEMFEIWLENLFRKAGYKVKRTSYRKDHGGDLILTDPLGKKICVQAKKLGKRNAKVGAKVIGEVLRAKIYYQCDRAMIVTNQSFTEQAIEEAKKIGIVLMDRKSLVEFVHRVNSRISSRS